MIFIDASWKKNDYYKSKRIGKIGITDDGAM